MLCSRAGPSAHKDTKLDRAFLARSEKNKPRGLRRVSCMGPKALVFKVCLRRRGFWVLRYLLVQL
jgi:hypothetical protein